MRDDLDKKPNMFLSGRPIPIEVAPFPVDENIPGEEDISEAVLRLQLHHKGGPSGMRDEHLRMWICAAKRGRKTLTRENGRRSSSSYMRP